MYLDRKALLLASQLLLVPAFSQTGIGHWRDHLSYQNTLAVVEGGGRVYCASSSGVFMLDGSTQELTRYSKVNALSDMNVSALGWNAQRGALVVGYSNGNVDVLTSNSAKNLADIKRSNISGSKAINSVECRGNFAYLACRFGIVVLDLERMEVRDSWIIGPGAGQLNVLDIAFHQDSVYAATDVGLFAADINSPNLASFTNWHKRLDVPRPAGPFNRVVSFGGRLMVNFDHPTAANADTLYYWDGQWQRMTGVLGASNNDVQVSEAGDRIIITHHDFVRQFNADLSESAYWANVNGMGLEPKAAVSRAAGGAWVASSQHGLVRMPSNGEVRRYFPNGPKNNSAYRAAAKDGRIYVSTGAPSSTWGSSYLKYGVHRFKDNTWNTVDGSNDQLLATGANTYAGPVNDFMGVVIDPDDPEHYFVGSWDEGVLEMRGEHVVAIHNSTNSSLQVNPLYASDGGVQVAGLVFDESGNLWVTNSNCSSPISVRTSNGAWRAYSPGGVVNGNTLLSDIVVDQNGYKWMVRPRSAGMLVFDDGGTLNDVGDDRYKVLGTADGAGKLPSLDVYSVAVDKDGEVWVGTGKGVAVFYNPYTVFENSGGDAQQVMLEQDGNYQLLLETEAVSAIAVDGADRKWLGTQNAGVFLVSADGTQLLQRFNADNSPLPGNNIMDITIDGASGEVFFATDQGVVSYRSDATDGDKLPDCAMVFPNPVRENYVGPVAINGLLRDSDVRITDVVGNLVFRATSLGGQVIWPATDLSGQRVSTGVYLVLATDASGTYSCNTKVLVVR